MEAGILEGGRLELQGDYEQGRHMQNGRGLIQQTVC